MTINRISKKKLYKTSSGYTVEIYKTDAGGEYPVHGSFLDTDGEWKLCRWTAYGRYFVDSNTSSAKDLVEVPMPFRLEARINVYRNSDGKLDLGTPVLDPLQPMPTVTGWVATKRIIIEGLEGDSL